MVVKTACHPQAWIIKILYGVRWIMQPEIDLIKVSATVFPLAVLTMTRLTPHLPGNVLVTSATGPLPAIDPPILTFLPRVNATTLLRNLHLTLPHVLANSDLHLGSRGIPSALPMQTRRNVVPPCPVTVIVPPNELLDRFELLMGIKTPPHLVNTLICLPPEPA